MPMLIHTLSAAFFLSARAYIGTSITYSAVINAALPPSVPLLMPICWNAEATTSTVPIITPPISSFRLRSMPFLENSLLPLALILSKVITTPIRNMPAIRLRAKPSVNAPISDAASCAAKANPQIIAARSKSPVDKYFFLFIYYSVVLIKVF